MKTLWRVLEEELGKNFDLNPQKLAKAVVQVSKSFTEDRAKTGKPYFESASYRTGYAAYFLPMNAEKIRFLLKQGENSSQSPPTNILDYGCGPGTGAIAFLEAYGESLSKAPPEKIRIHLVDEQFEALEEAGERVARMAELLGVPVEIRMTKGLSAQEISAPPYDLVLAANVFNELPPGDSTFEAIWRAPLAGGNRRFLLLEPSHRVASQRLIRLRKRLLDIAAAEGLAFQILGPCLHAQSCPLFRTPHWCHFAEPVTDKRLLAFGRKAFNSARDWMKFSYLDAVRLGSEGQSRQPGGFSREEAKTFRAIGDLHPSRNGKLVIDLCDPGKKFILELPRKMPQALKNKLRRGALIRWDAKAKKLLSH